MAAPTPHVVVRNIAPTESTDGLGRRTARTVAPLAAFSATDPIRSHPCRECFALPAQPHQPLGQQAVDLSMHRRHRLAPIRRFLGFVLGGQCSGHFAWTDRPVTRPPGEKRQNHVTRVLMCYRCLLGEAGTHGRFARPVKGLGLRGAFHPAGRTGWGWLVPIPIAPDRCRVRPDVSARDASSRLAPPRIKLISSRRRRASSKSNFSAAAAMRR